jgi:hypothetical protein
MDEMLSPSAKPSDPNSLRPGRCEIDRRVFRQADQNRPHSIMGFLNGSYLAEEFGKRQGPATIQEPPTA